MSCCMVIMCTNQFLQYSNSCCNYNASFATSPPSRLLMNKRPKENIKLRSSHFSVHYRYSYHAAKLLFFVSLWVTLYNHEEIKSDRNSLFSETSVNETKAESTQSVPFHDNRNYGWSVSSNQMGQRFAEVGKW